MRKGIIALIGALVFLAGCQNQQATTAPVTPKWKGLPYRLAFGTPATKPSPAGLNLPPIKYTANPDALETRADLVVQVDVSDVKKASPVADMMIMAPVDISGADGALPADYMGITTTELGKMLAGYCMKGNVKISVAFVRSSVSPTATDDQINDKRMSDWLPTTIVFKNPHPKC